MDGSENKNKAKKLAIFTSLYWLVPLVILLIADFIEIHGGLFVISAIVFGSGIGLIINFYYISAYVKILQKEIAERNEK